MASSSRLRSGTVRASPAWLMLGITPLLACGSSQDGNGFANPDGSTPADGSTGNGHDAAGDASLFGFGEGGVGDGGGSCRAPQMLIVLDHTDSMSAQPAGKRPPNTTAGHMLSKWYLATDAVKSIVAPPMDQRIAYGLEPFPLDPQVVSDAGATGACQTLSSLLSGMHATNTSCEPGEVLVPPAVGTGTAISNILDPETMRLCVSTPIAFALDTAKNELASVAVGGVAQYVLLVTDGGETCKGDVVGITQTLASAGVKTFVVGFGAADAGSSGVNKPLLDDVACAGMTAAGFPAPCTKGAKGYTATSTAGAPLFLLAEDGASLKSELESVASSICCGCTQ